MIRILAFTFLLATGLAGISQPYHFRTYSIEHGLSQSVVNCVFRDSYGYLWAGTQNGLNRFDGYQFTVFQYNPDDSVSLSNNWIYAIAEDKNGDLWIGTKQGLNRYDRQKDNFQRIPHSKNYDGMISSCVYDVIVASTGKIYLNTPPALTMIDPEKKTIRHYPTSFPSDGAVEDNKVPLLEDPEGDIWIGHHNGLTCFHPSKGSFSYFMGAGTGSSMINSKITALGLDGEANIWIGTWGGIFLLEKKQGTLTPLYRDQTRRNLFTSMYVRAFLYTPDGAMWAGTEGAGLLRFRRSGDNALLVDSYNNAVHGLGHNIVLSLTLDRSDNLWAGTLQGISKTDLKPTRFRLYRRDNTTTSVNLLGNVIASIFKNEDGKIWVGNWGQGLNILDRKTGIAEHFSSKHSGNHYIPNDFVHVIFRDENKNIWLGTRDGILVFNRNTRRFVRFHEFFPHSKLPQLQGNRIFKIIQTTDNSYWIASQSGLYHLDHHKTKMDFFTSDASGNRHIGANLIYNIVEDHLGYIWIATINGLDVFHPATGKMTHLRQQTGRNSLCDNFVISLCEDKNGDMWIGTSSFVNKFIRKDSLFLYFDKDDGLCNNNIFEILRDLDDNIWFATGGGLSRFDPATNKFRTYSTEDGLQGPEFNLRACHLSADGEVFFGGMNGFNSFVPGKLHDNPVKPMVVITACYTTKGTFRENLACGGGRVVELSHRDQDFTIEFVGLEFTNPEKNQYAYMLEGISPDWINIGTRRFVPFSNLSPGDYVFRVKCANNDGLWNEDGALLHIRVMPPWWRSGWAFALYLLIPAAILLIWIRRREHRLIEEKKIMEKKVQERTSQIEAKNLEIIQKNETLHQLNTELQALNHTKDRFFSIIAHDLRNPFNSIIGLTDILLQNLNDPPQEKTRKTVADIRETSKHAYDLLQNLLIWARSQTGTLEFTPAPLDLCEMTEENIQLVQGQAARKEIIVVNHVDEPVPFTGDSQMINTILRNLLTNAIKFTPREGKVEVRAKNYDQAVTIEVCDNGIGMAPDIIERIFRIENKFTRKGTEQERGSGLGLILCMEFAERHGGTIRVRSEPGKGSCFEVILRNAGTSGTME